MTHATLLQSSTRILAALTLGLAACGPATAPPARDHCARRGSHDCAGCRAEPTTAPPRPPPTAAPAAAANRPPRPPPRRTTAPAAAAKPTTAPAAAAPAARQALPADAAPADQQVFVSLRQHRRLHHARLLAVGLQARRRRSPTC